MNDWTSEQRELVMLYGVCQTCGAPRDFVIEHHEDGSVHAHMVCTASAEHVY